MKNHNKNHILTSMFKDIRFSPEEILLLGDAFELVQVKKGDVLIEVGQDVEEQYYVIDGCLRSYFLDHIGKEHTLMFGVQDWWVSDYTAYFNNTLSIVTVECIQDGYVCKLIKEDQNRLYSQIPKVETFFRLKMERAFAGFQKRILANISQPAKEHYRFFITTYPTIVKQVKNYHIASYLGITTESLSRIRKEIASE